jgi:hypothetical protein
MPFHYPEEQDETMMPERKFPAGTQTSAEQSAGVPDLPITWVRSWQRPERDIQAAPQGIGHRILQMGLGQPGSSSAAFIPWNGAKAQVLKSGPGHRMLGLAKSSFDPLEMRLHSGSGQSAFPMSKQKIGHRILAIGQKMKLRCFLQHHRLAFSPMLVLAGQVAIRDCLRILFHQVLIALLAAKCRIRFLGLVLVSIME